MPCGAVFTLLVFFNILCITINSSYCSWMKVAVSWTSPFKLSQCLFNSSENIWFVMFCIKLNLILTITIWWCCSVGKTGTHSFMFTVTGSRVPTNPSIPSMRTIFKWTYKKKREREEEEKGWGWITSFTNWNTHLPIHCWNKTLSHFKSNWTINK